MENAQYFLKRNLDSILNQKFKDYEIVISDDSVDDGLKTWLRDYPVHYFKNKGPKGMASNTNSAIDNAKGELVKILFQDDYFFDTTSLNDIDRLFTRSTFWLVTGCTHEVHYEWGTTFENPHYPFYSESENTIGSPSVLTIRQDVKIRFDTNFQWVLDLDLYKQLFREYGKPKILNTTNVVIGIHDGQTTHKLSDQHKMLEHQLLRQKYDSSSASYNK